MTVFGIVAATAAALVAVLIGVAVFDARMTRRRDELAERRRARAAELEQVRRRARLDVKERRR